MILSVIASVLLIISIAIFFGLTPEQIADDMMKLMTPNDTMRDKAKNVRGNRKKHRLYRILMNIKGALVSTGKSKQFTVVICASIVLFALGVIASVLIGNVFLMPVLSVTFALIPFLYITNTLSYYEKQTKAELETTLSIITTSYERCDDIVQAVRENIRYIKPPLQEVFMAFEGEATAVTSNIKHALYSLREKVDNDIFREWVDTLILCQDDRTLKDTLQPVVQKLADVRIVNSELSTMLASARNEYWMMVALVAGNIPLLYFLNKDWYHTLMSTTPGKIVLGVCGVVILVTAMFMMKFTKPVEYKR
jgi:Flp pilus assembly protein TadB